MVLVELNREQFTIQIKSIPIWRESLIRENLTRENLTLDLVNIPAGESLWRHSFDRDCQLQRHLLEGAPTDSSAWETGGEGGFRLLRDSSWCNTPDVCRSAVHHRDTWVHLRQAFGYF